MIGSSHRSGIGRVLIGGTGERLLSGASAPVAVAPAGYAATGRRIQTVACGLDASPESQRALGWAARLAQAASARLRVLSVYEPTLPASVAVGGGLATASVNDVLRRERQEELAHAVAAVDADVDVSETLWRETPETSWRANRASWTCWVVGSRAYGPRAPRCSGVSSALVRSAQSLVVVPRTPNGDIVDARSR